jgi:hypothetical protein
MLILIIIIFFILLFVFTNNDIQYGVSLIDGDIPYGTDVSLKYKINNGWLSGLKEDVKFKYSILNETNELVIPIGDMVNGEQKEDIIDLDTSSLSRGKYTIWTVLWYKELGLELTIY